MSSEHQISQIVGGNSLIDGIFLRRFDQSQIKPDSRIAFDDRTPIDQLNINDLINKTRNSCPGIYTYSVYRIDGSEAKIAISKEENNK